MQAVIPGGWLGSYYFEGWDPDTSSSILQLLFILIFQNSQAKSFKSEFYAGVHYGM